MTLAPLALDLSLTATGWATPDEGGVLSPPVKVGKGIARLASIRDSVLELLEEHRAELVVVEGYSFGSRGRQHAAGELGGVVRLALFEAGIPVVEVPPSCLKKYSTGKGNAPKAEVLAAAIRRLGFAGHDDNEADARWLLQMALARYGDPRAVQVPQTHRAALLKVQWPELTR